MVVLHWGAQRHLEEAVFPFVWFLAEKERTDSQGAKVTPASGMGGTLLFHCRSL